jgi:uncharacterized membrane protein YvbJ
MYTFQCSKCGLFNPPGSKFCQKCGGKVIDLWNKKLDSAFKAYAIMFSILLILIIGSGIFFTVLILLGK